MAKRDVLINTETTLSKKYLPSTTADGEPDGYLIDDPLAETRNQGHSLGNRFSDVKKGLFPTSVLREFTFHGLRRTFITAMEKAGIPESTAVTSATIRNPALVG